MEDFASVKKVARILLLENEELSQSVLTNILESEGHEVYMTKSCSEAEHVMNSKGCELVIANILISQNDGADILEITRKVDPSCDVIVITNQASISLAVNSLKLGTYDFIAKPFNKELIKIIIAKALEKRGLQEKAKEAEYYKQLSRIDGLTELYNHRFFQQLLETEISRAKRYEKRLSLIMFDIDNFKILNDTEGHIKGDVVLKSVAKILQDASREYDVLARYGGDEFAFIAPETDTRNALSIANRVKEEVESKGFFQDKSKKKNILTISAGIAGYPEEADTREELIAKADKALYRAKDMGKNSIYLYSGSL